MMLPARRRLARQAASFLAVATTALAGLATTGLATPAAAQGLFAQPKYAAIVEDANTGEVLYSMRAEALRHPASLTKVMTLYLTFEALATGRLRMSDVITISPHAFSMMPSKVSSHPGEQLTVAEAIPAMTVHSANDVAVAMAERLSGSEPAFARLMTLRARELGMTETSFVNASGLPPDGQQISSARDMAILARAVMRDYPQYYHFFGLKSIDYHGKTLMNHNHLVAKMPGVDGMKTGYTSLAGFNLVASGVRDGHRLITVVLGGPSVAARDENVEQLLDAGFTVLKRREFGQRLRLASLIDSPDDMAGPIERAPIEEGSADQANLRVEVQPQLAAGPAQAAANAMAEEEPAPAPPRAAPPRLALRSAEPDCTSARRGRRHHGRHAAPACAQDPTVAEDRVSDKPAKVGPAKAEKTAKVEAAEAAPCPSKGRRHRHAAACAKAEAVQTAAAAPEPKGKAAKDEDGGGYMIQVGAYKSRGLAQGELSKLSGSVSGSAKVEAAGGNYRARFRGLSEKQAKAACKSLSAKGHACMVMAAS